MDQPHEAAGPPSDAALLAVQSVGQFEQPDHGGVRVGTIMRVALTKVTTCKSEHGVCRCAALDDLDGNAIWPPVNG